MDEFMEYLKTLQRQYLILTLPFFMLLLYKTNEGINWWAFWLKGEDKLKLKYRRKFLIRYYVYTTTYVGGFSII
jgi:hypothetical protein